MDEHPNSKPEEVPSLWPGIFVATLRHIELVFIRELGLQSALLIKPRKAQCRALCTRCGLRVAIILRECASSSREKSSERVWEGLYVSNTTLRGANVELRAFPLFLFFPLGVHSSWLKMFTFTERTPRFMSACLAAFRAHLAYCARVYTCHYHRRSTLQWVGMGLSQQRSSWRLPH